MKIKKCAARGSERTPVGKLNKRTFCPLIDRLQRPVTWQNLSKLTNQRVYQILVYGNDLLLSFPAGVFSLPLAPPFDFFARCFLRRALTNWTPERGYLWACSPRRFWNLESRKCYFQHFPRDISSKNKSESSINKMYIQFAHPILPRFFNLIKARSRRV